MEHFLTNLPLVTAIWTGILFIWGLAMGYYLKKIACTSNGGRIPSDRRNFIIIMWLSILLALYLFVPNSVMSWKDGVLIINTFYTVFLCYVTIGVARWWSSYEARPCMGCPHKITCERTTEEPACDRAHYHSRD